MWQLLKAALLFSLFILKMFCACAGSFATFCENKLH